MLTLSTLCEEMEASGRSLSRRVARDWWTKGLLPRPRRHGLGRGRGTETSWTDPRVSEQARAAYDLLALYPRTDTTLLSLWLLGFPASLRSIRAIYCKLINRHLRLVHGQAGKRPDDIIGRLAEVLTRQQINKTAPADTRHAFADLAVEFLGAFFAVDSELVSEGLAELWEKAAPYMGGSGSQSGGLANLHPRDEDLETWVEYLKEMASLTAQKKTIKSADDYELIRARRLVLFVFGYLRRFARAAEGRDDVEEFGRRLLIELGRLAVPILIAALRKDTVRHKITSSLLEFARMLPRETELAAQMRTAHRQRT